MNKLHRMIAGATAGLAATAVVLSTALAPVPATAAEKTGGTRSLATVLAADGTRFDRNSRDFDILEAAVNAVLEAKPGSPLAAIADGKTRLTVFLPTDSAFKFLVRSLKGYKPKTEAKTFAAIAGAVDVDTLESILLYHVVAGKTLTSPRVLAADGTAVTTASGKKFRVNVTHGQVILVDRDPNGRNPRANLGQLDINRGNRQVGHGIDRVLRPVDL